MDNQQTVVVWDIFVRVFHWALVILVGIAFLTGDDDSLLHVYTGYAILLLIGLRLIWGMIGSEHARFASFITSPGAALDYLKGMLHGTSRRYLGHNPAAAWMMMALILLMLLVNATGYLAQPLKSSGTGIAAQSALSFIGSAWADDDDHHREESSGSEFWEELHEAGAGLLLGLIGLHVLGALVSSLLHRENLIRGMISGRKRPCADRYSEPNTRRR